MYLIQSISTLQMLELVIGIKVTALSGWFKS